VSLLSPGDKGFNSALKDAALKQDTALAFKTLNPYIRAQPDYLPLITATGVFLLQSDYIAQLYLHNHFIYSQRGKF